MVTPRVMIRMTLIGAVICALVVPAAAAEQTFEGTLVCAKCFLKKPDARDCQDILIVAAANGEKIEYYIRKNDVAEKAGESCTTQVKARVTGTVSQDDGKTWLTPSKIDKTLQKR